MTVRSPAATSWIIVGKTVDQGLLDKSALKAGWEAIYRFDLNNDGIVSGGDFLAIAPSSRTGPGGPAVRVCGVAGGPAPFPAFSQQ